MGLVLGLNGPAGAGKDTVADHLLRNHGWDAKFSFAGNLKWMCKKIFDLTEEDVATQEGKMREFDTPITLTDVHLRKILARMNRTHAGHPVDRGAFKKVVALVGTKLETPRRVLQFVGTDICRTLIPNYHVDVLVQAIQENPDARCVITDVRFPNEGNIIVDHLGGKVALLTGRSIDSLDKTHASETSMDGWGRFVDNIDNHREGLEFLYAEVNNFLERNSLCPPP